MKKQLKLSIPEIVIYSVCGVLAVWGIVYIILGAACNFVSNTNPIYTANLYLMTVASCLGFFDQGIIITSIAIVPIIITVLVCTKRKDIVLFSIFGAIGVWGFVYLCLGFACNFVNYNSGLAGANKYLMSVASHLGFLDQGIIITAVSVIAIVITLLVTSKKSDREYEKKQRRAARFSQRNAEVIDAEVAEEK